VNDDGPAVEVDENYIPQGEDGDYASEEEAIEEEIQAEAASPDGWRRMTTRQWGDILDGVTEGVGSSGSSDQEDQDQEEQGQGDEGQGDYGNEETGSEDEIPGDVSDVFEDFPSGSDSGPIPSDGGVVTYSAPITYAVPKTGYYCIGMWGFFAFHLSPAD
jgi:hypothetical protein